MPRRIWLFVLFAALAAALFVRLGVWQLHRRQQRLALNAIVRARLAAPPADFASLPHDTARARFLRARVTGAPDYAHELVLASRSRDGSPGVDIVTPVRIAGRDTAVLVVRGWVYSADGYHVDLTRWHDSDSGFVGYVEAIAPSAARGRYDVPPNDTVRMVQRLDSATVARLVPYPVSRLYLVALDDSARMATRPGSAAGRIARLEPPPLDEGPHLSYAIQWFSFAVIAVVGAGAIVFKTRKETLGERASRAG